MIEFLVPALGLTGLLPELIRAADNINLSGLAHLGAFSETTHGPIRRVYRDEDGPLRAGSKHNPADQFNLVKVVSAKLSALF